MVKCHGNAITIGLARTAPAVESSAVVAATAVQTQLMCFATDC